jgi:hypothetical protein
MAVEPLVGTVVKVDVHGDVGPPARSPVIF